MKKKNECLKYHYSIIAINQRIQIRVRCFFCGCNNVTALYPVGRMVVVPTQGCRAVVPRQPQMNNIPSCCGIRNNYGSRIIVSAKLFCQEKSIPLQKIECQCHTICRNGNRRVPHGTITMAEGIS